LLRRKVTVEVDLLLGWLMVLHTRRGAAHNRRKSRQYTAQS